MSDTEAMAGLAVSMVVMTPFMALAVIAIRTSRPVTLRAARIHVGAAAMILMGIGLIGYFLLHVLF